MSPSYSTPTPHQSSHALPLGASIAMNRQVFDGEKVVDAVTNFCKASKLHFILPNHPIPPLSLPSLFPLLPPFIC
jgi:hypothetical protein